MSNDAIQAAVKAAAGNGNFDLVMEYGVELKFRDNDAKEAAGKAVDWADLAKYSAVLPNGGRLGPKSDVAIVVALVSMVAFIKRAMPSGHPLDDSDVEAIKAVLASNVLCGRGSDCSIKSYDVQVLDNGHLRVIGTPSDASQEDDKGLNVFSVTTTDEGPVKLERHELTHQVPVQGSAA
tara:strand:- start:51 stop:587 length:537 start_codon:yes stop_codon:yes gene_type:complete